MTSTPFVRGFSDELFKLAQSASAIPVQRIPAGPSPAPTEAPRPPLPTGPAYKPAEAAPKTAPKSNASSGAKPVNAAWLQMADRAPTESTGKFVNRQYGVPERQMGVNQGKAVADAGDAKRPQMFRTLWASTPMSESYAPAVHVPEAKDTAKMNVPAYLQHAVGGINHTPQPYTLRNGQPQPYGTPGAASAPVMPKSPASAPTTAQPAQAFAR